MKSKKRQRILVAAEFSSKDLALLDEAEEKRAHRAGRKPNRSKFIRDAVKNLVEETRQAFT